MARNKVVFIVVAISVLLPWPRAAGDLYSPLSPLLSPLLNGLCDIVECGKGRCQASSNHIFGFTCECNPGWSQFHRGDHFRFLPCIIPNCSISYSCSKNPASPASAPIPAPPTNRSLFDPCMWAFCGGGRCSSTSTYEHECECDDGFGNLFNISSFPCYRDCSFGADCTNLGIHVINSTADAASPPSLSGGGGSSGGGEDDDGSILTFVMTLVVLWAYSG